MIYLQNIKEEQTIFIERNDGKGSSNNVMTITITGDTTVSEIGNVKVVIDASNYGQSQYDGGFEDGFLDGYQSGLTENNTSEEG